MKLKDYTIVYAVPYSREIQAHDIKDAETKGINIARLHGGRLISVEEMKGPQPGTEGGP